uniref:Uncharacterized protein n=1 Tax=Arion vulgaris TaxID=1028688 RepID=A0A0B6ZNV3_9EUPU
MSECYLSKIQVSGTCRYIALDMQLFALMRKQTNMNSMDCRRIEDKGELPSVSELQPVVCGYI